MNLLATAFAMANDTQQAQMIDEFARELFVRCGGRFRPDGKMPQGYETQVCNIAAQLTADGKIFIADLHAFLELRKQDMK